jgi:glutamate--cysteine ligase
MVDGLLNEHAGAQRFVAVALQGELMWNQSMTAILPDEANSHIGWYGTSNSGMLKHVYRRGLAERYGKTMQCIAGVHYNFSVPDEFWNLLDIDANSDQDRRSKGYLALIRNFTRHSWLLMYLFGASPAVSKNFLRGIAHPLAELDADTLYLPWATSLRMSDLGYQNKAQSDLQLCYNDIETFLQRIYAAVTTPWPAYAAIGTHRNGEWVQLSTSILQIENEYYSNIRPKRTTGRGERPSTALTERGVQYVEVRCLDIDPMSPVGVSDAASRFIDTFLLHCAVEESAYFPNAGFCQDSHDNFALVVKKGREPGLKLIKRNQPIALKEWAREIVEGMLPYAELLDTVHGGQKYSAAVTSQLSKIADSEQTPSAQLLQHMRDQKLSLQEYSLQTSRQHRDTLLAQPLSPDVLREYEGIAAESIMAQKRLEQTDTEDFDHYVARFHAGLSKPVQTA